MTNLKRLTYASVLTALAIIIPLQFGFLKIILGPFTATLASHVPVFLGMLLGPGASIMIGIGSTLGFLVTAPTFVAARAFCHVFVGLAGALLIKKGVSFGKIVVITAPLHGILEAIAVIPFGFTMYKVLVVVGIGSILHHLADGAIAFVLVKALSKNLKLNLIKSTTNQ
ncbi:niacin transporter NiaX [Clostridium acetireducens DSM 10703]|jgi:niacin transporter|uniref:Niacin transporter NiaX n=1 Tax=Clostridium acetireducens DSM 10703 TaxID=1121290 RepID=A0A1E8EXP5_9CLOT|nr:ECF transporter S component [Clostridium acetireducens]OFI05579.1 niacin transporter NiaX [Clostridium acetireducens DSM 10703]